MIKQIIDLEVNESHGAYNQSFSLIFCVTLLVQVLVFDIVSLNIYSGDLQWWCFFFQFYQNVNFFFKSKATEPGF